MMNGDPLIHSGRSVREFPYPLVDEVVVNQCIQATLTIGRRL